jgi:hypothetical protein
MPAKDGRPESLISKGFENIECNFHGFSVVKKYPGKTDGWIDFNRDQLHGEMPIMPLGIPLKSEHFFTFHNTAPKLLLCCSRADR